MDTAPPADPFASLPPLPARARVERPSLPPGPTAPRRVDRQLPPLLGDRTPAPRAARSTLGVTAHPPLAGNPRGAVAFVFDRAMVDATGPAPAPPPAQVTIRPHCPGTVRWLGDRTLVFTPRTRLKFATRYEVELRAGLRALSGARLRRPVTTGFTTAAPALLDSSPQAGAGELGPRPVFVLRFNQPVDPDVVRWAARLHGPGAVPLVEAPQIFPADDTVRLQPSRDLRPSTRYRLSIPAGLRGREGPLASSEPIRIPFTTAGPLRLRTAACRAPPCRPGDAVIVTTTGTRGAVCQRLRITPALPDLQCRGRGHRALLYGPFSAGTRYELRLADADGALTTAPPLTLRFTHRRRPLAFFPSRPLLATPLHRGLLAASAAPNARLRLAPVDPGMVSTLLTAIADPKALPPFHLARRAPQVMIARRAGDGFDLRALGARPALLLASLEGPGPGAPRARRTALVQRTGLSMVARYSWISGVALVTRLSDSRPVTDATVTLRDRAGAELWRGHTDARGLARFPGRRRLRRAGPYNLWASRGEDRCFVVLDGDGEDDFRTPGMLRGQPMPAVERVIGTVFTDRAQYAPGDDVRLFGLLRGQTRLPRGGIGHLSSHLDRLAYRILSEREEEVAAGQVPLGAAGLFRIDARLPHHARPGRYRVWLSLPGAQHGIADWVLGELHVVSPEPSLRLRAEGPIDPPKLDQRAGLTLRLRERNGRPVPGATVRWRLYRQLGTWPPPHPPEFRLGRAQGPSVPLGELDGGDAPWPEDAAWIAGGESTTDGQGLLRIHPRLAAPAAATAASFELVAEATTLGGRVAKTSRTVMARRHDRWIGIRPAALLIRRGAPLPVWLVATDGEGRPSPVSTVTVTAHRWEGDRPEPRVAARCEATLSLATGRCTLDLTDAGRFLLRAEGQSPTAEPAETVIYVHAGPRAGAPAAQTLELIPDREWYADGGTARVLLRSPVAPATALMTVERDGIAHAEVVALPTHETLVTLPLGHGLAPGAWIGATVVGARASPKSEPTGATPAPETMSERVRIGVRARHSRLRIALQPAERRARPRTSLPLALRVTDDDGRGVAATLVLYLQRADDPLPLPDPYRALQPERGPGVALRTVTAHLARSAPRWTDGSETDLPLPDDGANARADGDADAIDGPPRPRQPALFFRGPVQTDAAGRLALRVLLPRLSGRYRLVAVAADATLPHRVGSNAAELLVIPDLELSLTTPAALRLGDRMTMTGTVRNRTDAAVTVKVHARAVDMPVHPAHRSITLAPRSEGRVTFRVTADTVGLARLQVAAQWNGRSVATERRIVVKPSTRDEWVQRLGSLTGSAALPLAAGRGPRAGHGEASRLHLTLSNSPVGIGIDAIRTLLLAEQPTLEAAASRLLALALARRHRATPLGHHLPDATTLRLLCRQSVRQVRALQLKDGGLRHYAGGPPASVAEVGFALHGLSQARAAGCRAPPRLVQAVALHLRRVAASPLAEARDRVAAVEALHAAHLHTPDRVLTALLGGRRRLAARDRSRLLSVAVDARPAAAEALRRSLERAVRSGSLRDRTEILARLLLSGRQRAPRDTRLLVERLLAESLGDRWRTTRATTWALLALDAAAQRLAPGRPAIEARAWLDRRHWGGRLLDARGLDLLRLHAPHAALAGVHTLRLRARRGGPLYYRVALRRRRPAPSHASAPASLAVHLTPVRATPPPATHGPLRTRVGQNHVARVTVVTTTSLPATVLRVPIPAGCDVVDPGYPDWRTPGSSRQRRRFPAPPILDATLRAGALWLHLGALPPGIHEHRLVIQATAPGRFGCTPATLHRAADDRRLAVAGHCRSLHVLGHDLPGEGAAPDETHRSAATGTPAR